ncbi:MAG TPA: hypothetical protein VI997_11150 [Candidatus Thermoplasmatota archaeon]|nr:hypothetical protein [Candidatus Thermoplasmatota archaeon]
MGTIASAPAKATSAVQKYWKITAPVLAAVAALGFLLNIIGQADLLGRDFLSFDFTHNFVHTLLAALAFFLGYGDDVGEAVARTGAKIVGVIYLVLAIVGFLDGALFGLGPFLNLHLEIGENLIHLALGGWGAFVGFLR